MSTLRFNHPRDPMEAKEPTIDLLFSSCGIEAEVVREATPIRSRSGSNLPVAQIPHLIAMKTLSERDDRQKDREDLGALIRAASKSQLEKAAELVALIEQRGYNRDKSLQELLVSLVHKHRDQGHSR